MSVGALEPPPAPPVPAVVRPPTAEEVYHGAKHPRGRNVLHVALTDNNNEEVARLIESGDEILLTQQSTTGGVTPLMLLAMGHCDESLLWRLLERRAAVEASAALRSESRRTAADYAEGYRGSEVVKVLRALEQAERERTAEFRCPDCGDMVRRRPLLRFFWERAERNGEESTVLRRFFAEECYRVLMEPRFHQINEIRPVRKELSESMALLEAVRTALPSFDASWHVVDLCCGKALTGCLAALQFPGLAVTAVDRVEPRFVPHWIEVGDGPVGDEGSGFSYMCVDVLGSTFQETLRRRVEAIGRRTVLLGMHLCGALSLRAIDVFAALGDAEVLALAPCCLPAKGTMAAAPQLFASRDGELQYQVWAEYVEETLRAAVPEARIVSGRTTEVLSPKNFVLCAVKMPDNDR